MKMDIEKEERDFRTRHFTQTEALDFLQKERCRRTPGWLAWAVRNGVVQSVKVKNRRYILINDVKQYLAKMRKKKQRRAKENGQ